jgi:uncharacterized MAPEG superfamily protein
MMETNKRSKGADPSWRGQRRVGLIAIGASSAMAVILWLAIRYFAPFIPDMDSVGDRMIFAFKWSCLAVLFCLAMGIDAVAHERLQSPAFDPLAGYETRRMRVNVRYLQNTLEQIILFVAGLFGLALYMPGGDAMRAVEATAIVWILARLAFWAGYHRSAAMRGIGAPGVAMSLLVLIYVGARISYDFAGVPGAVGMIILFLLLQALLFWVTRERGEVAGSR